MLGYWMDVSAVRSGIFIPKYYDPELRRAVLSLSATHDLLRVGDLIEAGVISLDTGDEIGSESYGTGNIPFVRTSDISNWEIKTAPKQGVSEQVYARFAPKQDVREGDILLVRDGTYLIGTNCFVTALDAKLLFQSHILRIRVEKPEKVSPQAIFLALNGSLAQRQIRSVQFTADIIDTIGSRFEEVLLPVPRDAQRRAALEKDLIGALDLRVRGKCFVKQAPLLLEETLRTGSAAPMRTFLAKSPKELSTVLVQDTVSLEFGGFEAVWVRANEIRDSIFLPKYYDPEIDAELEALGDHCDVLSIGELRAKGVVEWITGDEPGKMAYGTGDVPFIRTSDFANWEIKHDPKQGMAEFIYAAYRKSQDVRPGDVLLVRDGTYLVGSSTIVQAGDDRMVFCGGLFKLRSLDHASLSPYLLLALLNSYIVKRQMRSKQFTRDVIDTLGRRIDEVRVPIPRSGALREEVAAIVRLIVESRLEARNRIKALARESEELSTL